MRQLFLAVLLAGLCLADHLPDNLVQRGKADVLLCGIDVYHTTLADLKKRFGTPLTEKPYPDASAEVEAVWEQDGSRIHVVIDAGHVAEGLDVSGKPSPVAKTGRGLALGQSLADIKRIYGSRYFRQGDEIRIEWEDGTHLTVTLSSGRISRLQLGAGLE
jgi:hypothetical protein